MKTLFNYTIILSLLSVFTGCTNTSKFQSTPRNPNISVLESGSVVINEFSAKAVAENEYGLKSDWIELYNTTENDIHIKDGAWTITDDITEIDKYYIPDAIIPAKGHLVLWCDGQNKVNKQIHTNFKLSSNGESIALHYRGDLMDSFTYSNLDDVRSFGKNEDGGNVWHTKEIASIGSPN